MSETDTHSVIINIPRPRVFLKESLCDKKKGAIKKVSEKSVRKPSDASLRKYSLPNSSLLHVKAFKKDHLLIPYRLYTKKQESVKCKQRLGIKLEEKYKIINTDLRKRLHVEDPLDDVHAVTDIDESYFRYLSGQPLIQYIPLYKSLKFQFHEQLRTRQEVGYRQDCVLNIEENYRTELQKYESSIKSYMKQVKQFDTFISVDYQKSMICLKKSENLLAKVDAKQLELEYLANKQFITQSKLIGLDCMYYKQQKYGRFLYYLSPPSWRAKHRDFARSVEIEAKGFDLGSSSEEDTFNVIFEKMQNECLSGLVKPVLYFSKPEGLIAMFESLEKQQLHHLTHVNCLTPHAKMLNKVLTNLKNNVEKDSAFVAEIIYDTENLLDFCEERGVQLQAIFMKILYGLFYDTVAATDVVKLQMHLEFCYEKVYGEKSSNMTLLSTAKALEDMYMKYSFKLEDSTNDTIIVALKQCTENEKIKIRRAHMAARELRLFGRLEHALLRAFEKGNADEESPLPAVKRPRNPKLKLHLPNVVRRSSQRELTEAEIEYLTLFTDWTETEDAANFMQSL